MKKTLVALAALATVGAAFAQSTVTLYGRVDANFGVFTQSINGVKTADNNKGPQLATGNALGQTGSRWGLKGSEDLGGGMSALFQLENGFAADTGAIQQSAAAPAAGANPTIRQFGRQAYAGLSGGFGTFTFGRQYSPLDAIWGSYDAQGYYTSAPIGFAWNNGPAPTVGGSAPVVGVHLDIGRIDNSLMYSTPNIGGFTAAVMWAPGENKNPATGVSASRFWSMNAQYNNGPLGIGFGYDNTTVKSVGVSTKVSDWTLGAQYNFGPATLYGMYERGNSTNLTGTTQILTYDNCVGCENGAGRDKGYDIGVKIPFGAATFATSYAEETTKAPGAALSGKNKYWGAQVSYSLSKRSTLYAMLLDGSSTPAGGLKTKNTNYLVGMRHEF